MVVVLLLVIPVIAAMVFAVGRRRREPTPVVPPSSKLAEVDRRTSRWRWAGSLVGVAGAASAIAFDGPLGRGTMLAAPLLCIGVLGGVIVGELRVGAPGGPVRRSSLEVRRVRDYLPARLATVVAGAAVLLAVTLAATSASGSADDLGRAGRRLVHRCSASVFEERGPWPGSFYSVPLALVLGVGLLGTAFALHRIVQRPRQGEDVDVDDALRARSAGAVTAATGLLVAVPFAGVGVVTGIALLGVSCGPWWYTATGTGLVLLVPALLALAGWCTAVLLRPASSVRAPVLR